MEQTPKPGHGFPFGLNITAGYPFPKEPTMAPPSRKESIPEIHGILVVTTLAILFVVILFGFLLYVYAKLFWRRSAGQYLRRDDGSFSARRLNFAAEDPLFLQGGGLDPSVVANLPTFVYKSENFKDGSLQCAVCLCELKDNERARQLPKCNHSFHTECIDMWFHSHSTCPLCRASVHPDPPSNAVESGSARQISDSNSMAEDRVSSYHSIDIEMHTNPIHQHAEREQTSAIAEKDIIRSCTE